MSYAQFVYDTPDSHETLTEDTVSTNQGHECFTPLPDEQTIAATVVALEEHVCSDPINGFIRRE